MALALSSFVARAQADLVQINAPSINSASPDLLDHAAFPAIAGVALDRRFKKAVDQHALTLDLTLRGLLQLAGHGFGAQEDPGWASRAAARVTVGGPLQFIDSLRAAHAGRATNHVTSELKLRMLGPAADLSSTGPVTVALALTADNLGTGYGLDRYGGTLIAERAASCAWTANAGYRILERYRSTQRMAETKLGLGAQWRWVRVKALDLGLSGACLLRNHRRVPVWQGGARADLELDGLRLSLATRESDHPEVRGDQRYRNVLSVAYDLAGRR